MIINNDTIIKDNDPIIRTKSLIQPFYQGTIYNPTIEQWDDIKNLIKMISRI